MKKLVSLSIATFFALFAPGCAINPKAKYITNPSQQEMGNPHFYLNGSIINMTIPPSNTEKEDTASKKLGFENKKLVSKVDELKDAKVTVTKTEDKNIQYYIDPYETFYYKSNITIIYHDNTKLVKSIGTDAKDERKEVIATVGGVISKALPLAMSLFSTNITTSTDDENLTLPLSLDITKIDLSKNLTWTNIPDYKKWWFRIIIKDDLKNSLTRDSFFNLASSEYVRLFPFSSCQNITFDITKSDTLPNEAIASTSVASFNLTVANPNFIDGLNLPPKGTITMHTICGADLKREDTQESSALDLLGEVFKQAESIKKSYDSTKKTSGEAKQ